MNEKWEATHQRSKMARVWIFNENTDFMCEAVNRSTAKHIVTAVNNHDALVGFLRYVAEGSCLGETPELTLLDCGNCEYCGAKALLAGIDREDES